MPSGRRRSRRLRILVTAGPTREPIDAVRFLSNRSSGRLGYAVAAAARARGHRVTLVSGPTALPLPRGVRILQVETALQMRRTVHREARTADILFMAAAVSDYRPARPGRAKRRKTGARVTLPLVRNPDILAEVCGGQRRPWAVGWALESSLSERLGRRKLRRKGCDRIVLNSLASMGGRRLNAVVLGLSGLRIPLSGKKETVARRLVVLAEREAAR